ncbi:MAG: zf-HC2 domain-containing protein [Methylococcaceae bacterium]
MKSCKEITELLSESMERSLTWRESWAIKLHFFMCRSCPVFQKQILFLRKAAGDYYLHKYNKTPPN